ncbi:MAG: WD40 repeat domain-containing protein [Fimbriimonadaceae bacterium]
MTLRRASLCVAFAAIAGASFAQTIPTFSWTQTIPGFPGPVGASVSNNGQLVAFTTFGSNLVAVLNTGTGSIVREVEITPILAGGRDTAFTPDSENIGVSINNTSGNLGQIQIFRISDGALVRTFEVPAADASTQIAGFGFNTAGTEVIGVSRFSRKTYVWDYATGNVLADSPPAGSAGLVNHAAVSADGSLIAIGLNQSSNNLWLVNRTTIGDPAVSYVGYATSINGVAISYDNQKLAAAGFWEGGTTGKARVWNIGTPASPAWTADFAGSSIAHVIFSRDNQQVVATGRFPDSTPRIQFYSAADGTLLQSFNVADPQVGVQDVVFSIDNSTVFVGAENNTLYAFANPNQSSSERSTLLWEGPNSGPLPRLLVAWRIDGTAISLPTVVIDVAPADWSVRTFGPLTAANSTLVWQNTNPAFSIPGLVALWDVAESGTPSPAGTVGAPPAFNWQVRGLADVDGDGAQDLIWFNIDNQGVAIWFRDEAGVITGTAFVGTAVSTWNLVGAANSISGSAQILFQDSASNAIAYYSVDETGSIFETVLLGFAPNADWQARGLGDIDGSRAVVFINTATQQVAFWNFDTSGNVTATGTIDVAPAGWNLLGIGQL